MTCEADGYCNPHCVDEEGTPTDEDCNPVTPLNSEDSSKSDTCDCDYWGFVCEAAAKCSTHPCPCDPDCAGSVGHDEILVGEIAACNADEHCDSWCPTGADPDCEGHEWDGKQCDTPTPAGPSFGLSECDYFSQICDASADGTAECADDPDCDGETSACSQDGACDIKCAEGADPDC